MQLSIHQLQRFALTALVSTSLVLQAGLVIASEGADEGVPKPTIDLAFWSVVVFGVLLFILARFAWGPLSEALDAREAGIRKDLSDAESARLKAEKMLQEYDSKLNAATREVREMLDEAKRDAEATKNRMIAEAQAEASLERKRALDDISRARDQAIDELFKSLEKQVLSASEQVIGRSLAGDDHERLVREALAGLPANLN